MTGCGRAALLVALAVGAGGRAGDAPAWVRAQPHMYNAVGRRVAVGWSADRTSVAVGQPVVVTLTVRGADDPAAIVKPDLGKLRAFADAFVVEPQPDPPTDAGEVRFCYKLSPRTAAVAAVPALEFRYFVTGAPDGSQVQTTYAKKLPLTVTEGEKEIPAGTSPAARPNPFRDPLPALGSARRVEWIDWFGLIAGLAAVTAGYVAWWRQRHPDGDERERRRKYAAYQRAMGRLTAGADAGRVAEAVREYVGVCGESAGTTAVLAGCDAARFAPAGTDPTPLVEAARRAVTGEPA